MSVWKFRAYDLRTSDFLTELDVTSWTSTDDLNDAGSWSATVVLDGAAATDTTARRTVVADSTQRGRSLIVAERDGVPVYAGIVWRRRYQADQRVLELAGRGLLSYFDHWSQTEQWSFTGEDQFDIFNYFVNDTQIAPAGGIGIELHSGTCGVDRDRTYERFSGKYVGDLMRELAAVKNGFDFNISVEYNAGAVERRLRLFYPRRGRDFTDTGLRFYAPGNADLFSVDDDGTDMATTVVMLGAGDGQDMKVRQGSATDLINAGWPGYRVTRARKDIKSGSVLQNWADAEVARLSGVDSEVFTIEVDPNFSGQPFGSWTIGDDCRLIVVDDPLYPAQDDGSPGLVVSRRVLSHTWQVSDGGERLTVGLGRKVIE